MIVAPSEPIPLRALGFTDLLPEKFGVDFLWSTEKGQYGIQRKAYPDLIASVQGDRLARELAQMKQLDYAWVLIEGCARWDSEGREVSRPQWTVAHDLGVQLSIYEAGAGVLTSTSLDHTRRIIADFEARIRTVGGFKSRPKPVAEWGVRDNADWAAWVLQSFDGVSAGWARAILEHFGTVPLRWDCTVEEMAEVKSVSGKGRVQRLGRVRAEKMIRALREKGEGE